MTELEKEPDFVAQGSYGCVFNPPFQCDDPSKTLINPGEYVGKVFNENEWEWENTRKIMKIDPEGLLFLYPALQCDVGLKTLKKGKNLAKCDLISDKQEQYSQLISSKGGVTLDDYIHNVYYKTQTKLSCANLIYITSYILYGIKQLLNYGYIHQDLKGDNILISPENGIKIIDFGFLTDMNDFYSEKNMLFGNDTVDYRINPTEYRLVRDKDFENDSFVEKEENMLYSDIKINTALFKSRIESLKNNLPSTKKERIEYLKSRKVHEKSDIFSLGVLIKYFIETPAYMMSRTVDDATIVKLVDVMVDTMINPNPLERADINTLLKSVWEIKQLNGATFKFTNIDDSKYKEFEPFSLSPPSSYPSIQPTISQLPSYPSIQPTISPLLSSSISPTISPLPSSSISPPSMPKVLKPEFELVQKKYKYSSELLLKHDAFFVHILNQNIAPTTFQTLQEFLMTSLNSCADLINININTQKLSLQNYKNIKGIDKIADDVQSGTIVKQHVRDAELEKIKALCDACDDDILKFAYESRNFRSIPHDFVKLAVFLKKQTKYFNIYVEKDRVKVTDNDINIYEQLCKIVDICIVKPIEAKIKEIPDSVPKTLSALKVPTEHILDQETIEEILKKASGVDQLFDEKELQISKSEYIVSMFLYIVIFLLVWDSQRNKTLDLVSSLIGSTTYTPDQNAPIDPPFQLTSVCSNVFYTCTQTVIFIIVIKVLFMGIKWCTKKLKSGENSYGDIYQTYWTEKLTNHAAKNNDTEKYERKHERCVTENETYNEAQKVNIDTVNDCYTFPFHLATESLAMVLSLLSVELILWIYAKLIVQCDINLYRLTTVQMHVNIMFFLFLVIYLILFCYLTYLFKVNF